MIGLSSITDNGILGNDPEIARPLLGSLVRFARWASIVYLAGSWFEYPAWGVSSLVGGGTAFLGSFAIQTLVDKNRLRVACWAILAIIYLAILPGLLDRGTTSSVGLLVLSSIPLSALLLGMNPGIAYALLHAATYGIVAFCQARGILHPSGTTNFASWIIFILISAWSIVAYQAIPIRGVLSALQLANRERSELDSSIADLRKGNEELETTVEKNTEGLRRANENATRLAAYLSHDLHAPLRTIRGFSKILAEEDIPDSVKVQVQGILSDVESMELVLEKTMQNLRRESQG